MGQHAEYGKQLLKTVAGAAYAEYGPSVEIDYKAGRHALIDGTIGTSTAVEIESRVSKQVRGAVLDLICHKYPKKLLVILPVHASNPYITAEQCRYILSCFVKDDDFRVVVTEGSGDKAEFEKDAETIRNALRELDAWDAQPATAYVRRQRK